MKIVKFKGIPRQDMPHPEKNSRKTLKVKLFTCQRKTVICAYNPRVWGELENRLYKVEAYEYNGRVLARLIKEA